jgi:hypothetical protein
LRGKEKLMIIKEPADPPHEGCSPQLFILVKHICNITIIVAIATFFWNSNCYLVCLLVAL